MFSCWGQALQYLVVVLRASAGRAALEALQPESAALLRAYIGGRILGVNVTTAGALSAWTRADAFVSLLSVAVLARMDRAKKKNRVARLMLSKILH